MVGRDVAAQLLVRAGRLVGRAVTPAFAAFVPGLIGQEVAQQSLCATPAGRLVGLLLAISHETTLDRFTPPPDPAAERALAWIQAVVESQVP